MQERDGGERDARGQQLAHLLAGSIHEGRIDPLQIDIDCTFASEPEPPERLVVGTGVVMQHAVFGAAQDSKPVRANVRLEAAAADPA